MKYVSISLTCQEFKKELQINTSAHLSCLQIYVRRGKNSATALSILSPGTLSSKDQNMPILFMLKKYNRASYVIMRQYLFQSKMPYSCHYLQFKWKNFCCQQTKLLLVLVRVTQRVHQLSWQDKLSMTKEKLKRINGAKMIQKQVCWGFFKKIEFNVIFRKEIS